MRLKLSDNRYIDIEIKRKKIKNIILRVYPDGNVKISAPNYVKDKDIKQFAEQKIDWITDCIEKAELRRINNNSEINSIRFFGEQKELKLLKSNSENINVDENNFIITFTESITPLAVLESRWRKYCARYLNEKVELFMPVFKEYDIQKPKISIRKMKSLWGSCTPKKGTVRFNYYLLTVPDKCIDYIVLHELTHLIHPDHGKSFKAFLTKNMPDWKERKKLINSISYIEDMQKIEKKLTRTDFKT